MRGLVNHVVGANRRYTMLLHGASASEVDVTRSADHLSDDAVASFLATASEMRDAFRGEGALARTVHHPAGDRSGVELLDTRILDVSVHAWDLACAVDADESLASDVVDFALAVALSTDLDSGRRRGSFTVPIGDLPAESSPPARLLHLVGRHPTRSKETG